VCIDHARSVAAGRFLHERDRVRGARPADRLNLHSTTSDVPTPRRDPAFTSTRPDPNAAPVAGRTELGALTVVNARQYYFPPTPGRMRGRDVPARATPSAPWRNLLASDTRAPGESLSALYGSAIVSFAPAREAAVLDWRGGPRDTIRQGCQRSSSVPRRRIRITAAADHQRLGATLR
jgi:hypothetical protein